jgi:hypothetical protein
MVDSQAPETNRRWESGYCGTFRTARPRTERRPRWPRKAKSASDLFHRCGYRSKYCCRPDHLCGFLRDLPTFDAHGHSNARLFQCWCIVHRARGRTLAHPNYAAATSSRAFAPLPPGSTDGRAKNGGTSGEALSPGAVACAFSGGKHGSVESQFWTIE